MIAEISGKIKYKRETSLFLELNGLCYEVLVPPAVMRSVERASGTDGVVTLITYHYYQMDQNRAVPVLVGFMHDVEREFFEQFITVSGVGPKAACKALSAPISSIADAIDRGDISFLKTLPGIGDQRARQIIAKLQGKVGKYGLLRDRGNEAPSMPKQDMQDEAVGVLLQLQYKKHEAVEMVESALKRSPALKTCEEILNEVYKGIK